MKSKELGALEYGILIAIVLGILTFNLQSTISQSDQQEFSLSYNVHKQSYSVFGQQLKVMPAYYLGEIEDGQKHSYSVSDDSQDWQAEVSYDQSYYVFARQDKAMNKYMSIYYEPIGSTVIKDSYCDSYYSLAYHDGVCYDRISDWANSAKLNIKTNFLNTVIIKSIVAVPKEGQYYQSIDITNDLFKIPIQLEIRYKNSLTNYQNTTWQVMNINKGTQSYQIPIDNNYLGDYSATVNIYGIVEDLAGNNSVLLTTKNIQYRVLDGIDEPIYQSSSSVPIYLQKNNQTILIIIEVIFIMFIAIIVWKIRTR